MHLPATRGPAGAHDCPGICHDAECSSKVVQARRTSPSDRRWPVNDRGHPGVYLSMRHTRAATAESAIEAFVADEGYPRVVRALAVYCGDRGVAEDLAQEALARAWAQLAGGKEIRSLTAWVTTVSMNLARSRFRRLRIERRTQEELSRGAVLDARRSIDDPAQEIACRQDIVEAVGALPRRQRQAVVLRYWLEMTVPEIATELRVTEGTIKSSLHRGRAVLEHVLSDAPDDRSKDRVHG
jgi:RNA polymerase sigma factor (sigma-70 family)